MLTRGLSDFPLQRSLCINNSLQPLNTAYNALDPSLETKNISLQLNVYSLSCTREQYNHYE